MRKILSIVIVLSLVLGSFSFALAAPKDVEGTDYEDAVTRLEALGILAGFPDGKFRPNETVTRAQCAKIMVHALGVGEAAKYAAGQTKFADVAANHWATGYINVASDMKIINGYGDGNFGPEDKVTYAQAITMIVRALGYEPKAEAFGGYPGGYLAIAAEEDITDNINVVNTLAATRGDIALMVDAALDVPLMYQKTWGQYPEYTNDDESRTLLTEKLNVEELSGRVVAIPNTDSTIEENEVKIEFEDGRAYKTKTYELLVDVNYASLLGLEVTVWADESEVFFLDIDTDSDDIVFDTASEDSTNKVISLVVEDDDFDWDNDAQAYLNFEEVDLDEIPKNAYGYIVFDSNDEIIFANFFKFDEVDNGVVIEDNKDRYTYYDEYGNDRELDLEDYDDGVFVYNDKFIVSDIDEIDVDSAIFAWEVSDELYLVVKNESVKGTLDRVKTDKIRVDGEDINKSIYGAIYSDDGKDTINPYDEIDDLENLCEEDVKVILDLNGDALFICGESEASSSTIYGIVTYGEVGRDAEITVYTKDDEEITYIAEDRGDFSELDEDDDSVNYFGSDNSLKYALISCKLNSDGEINDGSEDIVFVQKSDSPTVTNEKYAYILTKSEDKKYVNYKKISDNSTGRFYFDSDTVILQAVTDKTNEDLSPDVIDYDTFVDMAFSTNGTAVVYGDEDKDAEMIVMLDKDFKGSKVDFYYGIVTDSPWSDSGDYVVTIDVFDVGEDEYKVHEIDTVEKGDMIAFTLDSDDEAIVRARYDLSEDDIVDSKADVDNDSIKEIIIYQETNVDVDSKYLSGSDTWKMDSDAVVYELTSSGKLDDEVGYNRIGDGDDVTILVNEDEKVVAAIINAYHDPTPVKPEPVISELQVEYDGTPYDVANGKVQININGATTLSAIDIAITGTVSDDKEVISVKVNSKDASLSGTGKEKAFTYGPKTLDLSKSELPLEIQVTVVAEDDNSNKTTEVFTIEFVDVPIL